MSADLLLPALVALLPVLSFLAALLYLDSYKLVELRAVIAVVAGGAAVAGASYVVNGQLLDALAIDFTPYTRYVAPLTEELLKGLVIVALIRGPSRRLPGGRGDLRVRRRRRLRDGREHPLPAAGARRRDGDLDRARLRHRDHARRRHRDIRA